MPHYLALITVHATPDEDSGSGMADALGSNKWYPASAGGFVFEVPGEAPDATTAQFAATQHAAEVLDGYDFEAEVREV